MLIWTLKRLSNMLDKKRANDFDAIVIIVGATGLGKTTLAVHLARKSKYGQKFNAWTDLVYQPKEVIASLEKWNSISIVDETINVGFRRDWQKIYQKNIIKQLNMNRDHRNLVIFCISDLNEIDPKILKMCRLMLVVVSRGTAVVLMKNESVYSADKWDIQVNQKIERECLNKNKQIDYSKFTTYRGIVRFKKLPPTIEKKVKQVKTEKRNIIYKEDFAKEEKKELSADARLMMALIEGKIANKKEFLKLCDVYGLKYTKVYNSIRNQLRKMNDTRNLKDFYTDNLKKEIEKHNKKKIKEITQGLSKEVVDLIKHQ